MKLSEKQAMQLFIVLKDSLHFDNNMYGIGHSDCMKLVNEIMRQQSEELIDIDQSLDQDTEKR